MYASVLLCCKVYGAWLQGHMLWHGVNNFLSLLSLREHVALRCFSHSHETTARMGDSSGCKHEVTTNRIRAKKTSHKSLYDNTYKHFA